MKNHEQNKSLSTRRPGNGVTSPLQSLHRSIDRLFENFLSPGDIWGDSNVSFSPPTDIEEKENEYCVCMEIPGVDKKDIHVEVRDNNLVVSGERKQEREEKGEGRYFSERSYGTFSRSFALPTNVDVNQIKAECNNGVLELILPKTEKTQAKNIPIGERKVN